MNESIKQLWMYFDIDEFIWYVNCVDELDKLKCYDVDGIDSDTSFNEWPNLEFMFNEKTCELVVRCAITYMDKEQ